MHTEHFKVEFVLRTEHVRKSVAVLVIPPRINAFSMQVNYFHPLTFGMTVPLFREKKLV